MTLYDNLEFFPLPFRSTKLLELFLPPACNALVASAIVDLVMPSGKQTTLVVENDYVDKDQADTYARLQAHSHRDYPRRCYRLHFFDASVFGRHVTAADLQSRAVEGALNKAYLGFCVLSPTTPQTIGRTVLRHPSVGGHFILGKDEYPVNLMGVSLRVEGTPFMEQDRLSSVCATASMWVATSALARKSGLALVSPAQLTGEMLGYVPPGGWSVPIVTGATTGPTTRQIIRLLGAHGYCPVVYEPSANSGDEPKETIYKYVESGIPVVVTFKTNRGWHAVTIIGHAYDTDATPTTVGLGGTKFYRSSQWVPYFIAHDDQSGPYRKLVVADRTVSIERCTSKYPRKPHLTGRLGAIIACVPPGILLSGHEAEFKMISLLRDLGKEVFPKGLPDDLVLRTFVVASNDFKRSFDGERAMSCTPGVTPLAVCYRGTTFSRHVWVMEIATLAHRSSIPPEGIKIIGEIAVDAKAIDRAPDFEALHLPGRYYRMRPDQQFSQSVVDDWLPVGGGAYPAFRSAEEL